MKLKRTLTKPFRGNGNHSQKACVTSKVNRIQRDLHGRRKQNRRNRNLMFRRHFAEDVGEWESVIARKGVYGAGSLSQEAIGRYKSDGQYHCCQYAGSDNRICGIGEDLDERDAGA